MKPMSPDEEELEAQRSRLSGFYRAGSTEEPAAHVDAAILAAARREVALSRFARSWHLPASLAAVLVIGVSLALMTNDIEDSLPPADTAAGTAEQARQAAPAQTMKRKFESRAETRPGVERESRPSRDRSARIDRDADSQNSVVGKTNSTDTPASVAAAVPGPALKQFEGAAPPEAMAERKDGQADAVQEKSAAAGLRKEAAPSSATAANAPEEWLKRIGELLRDGKTSEAREQLAGFRKRYPDYRLPEALRELEAQSKQHP